MCLLNSWLSVAVAAVYRIELKVKVASLNDLKEYNEESDCLFI